MVAAPSLAFPEPREQRILIHGVRWRDYVIVREAIDSPGVRMTYLKGVLEIMSPSPEHENAKKRVARLLEGYAYFARISMEAYGSTTFRKEAKERGAEPDECYVFGGKLEDGGFPDLVVEVIETAPLLDKLEVYDGFGVPEVWLFENGKFLMHRRKKTGGYAFATKSAFLPELDLRLIERLVPVADVLDALDTLRDAVREAAPRKPARSRHR